MRRRGLAEETLPEGTVIVPEGDASYERCGAGGGVYKGTFLLCGDAELSYNGDSWQPAVARYCTSCRTMSSPLRHPEFGPWRNDEEYRPVLRRHLIAHGPSGVSLSAGACPECGLEAYAYTKTWDSSVDTWEDHRWVVCVNPVCSWRGSHSYNSGSYLFG